MKKAAVFLMLASTLVLAIALVVLVREFAVRSEIAVEVTDLPTTAVVFTGQFDRIELALQLFDQGRLDRIFISGVNGRAGILPRNFADQFRLSENARAALDTGQIILAPDADTTLENALETACWLDGQPGVHEILLIAGPNQMPRASWALESALTRPVLVRRLSPEPSAGEVQLGSRNDELLKFAMTVPLALIPRFLWPAERPASCM